MSGPVRRAVDAWLSPMPARRLALLRVLVVGYSLIYILGRAPHLYAAAGFPLRQFKPVGPVAMLGASPLPSAAVAASIALCIVSGLVFMVGLRARISGIVFALSFAWVTSYRSSWGMIFHTENLMVLHVLVLALSRCADTLSLDARRRGGEPPPDSGHYGWPIRLMCAVTVSTYCIAGITKLQVSGLSWITSDTLRGLIAHDNLRKVELGDVYSPLGAFLSRHGWLFPPLAAGSIALELFAPLAMVSRRLGQWWCAAAWSFHLGVLVIMAIFFHYPLIGVAFASFFDVEKLEARLRARIDARRADRARKGDVTPRSKPASNEPDSERAEDPDAPR